MKIITLTLNPAFDVHCHALSLALYHENLATVTSRDAGGKGVNVSRALTENGVENIALVVLGQENADEFRRALAAEGITTCELEVAGRIRENFTLHTDGARETRISFSGFDADAALLSRVEERLAELIDGESIVTLTGRVPDGIAVGEVKAFLRRLQDKGTRIVIDSKSFTLSDLIECKPYLIKPNEEEIAEYIGKNIITLSEAADAAEKLHREGIENVMISLGAKGAVLACAEGVFSASAPQIEVRSTIGAGDSSIAGFLAAAVNCKDAVACLRTAVAYGTAACLTAGTQAPRAEDIRTVLARVRVCRA